MQKTIATIMTGLALQATLAGGAWADGPAAFREMTIPAPHHGKSMAAGVWYPSGGGGSPARVGENGVFHGIEVMQGAAVAAGQWPVVLVSHGLGAHFKSVSWLSASLAQRGAIVIAVSHPNSSFGDFDMRRGLDHGTRVRDLQAALEAVLADPVLAKVADQDRVYAAGFSFGGWTALSIGGLKGNLAGYAAHCQAKGMQSSHCRDLAKAKIDLASLDPGRWDAPYKDARIKAVAAIDPAFTWGHVPDDSRDLVDRVLLIGLGNGADRLAATDFSESGSGFAARHPAIRTETIVPASHFTALLVCKPNGPAILIQEKDDPVCTDPPGTDRKAVHDRVIAAIAETFGLK